MNSVFNPSAVLTASQSLVKPAVKPPPKAMREATEQQIKVIQEKYTNTSTRILAAEVGLPMDAITRIGKYLKLKKDLSAIAVTRLTAVDTTPERNGFRRDRINLKPRDPKF